MRSLPKQTWLPELRNRNRKIPARVAKELSNLPTMRRAQEFIESAGLEVLTDIQKDLEIVYLIPIHSPECLTGFNSSNLEYFAPQVFLPKIECKEIPFGTVSANFILPSVCSSESKRVLQEYQEIFIALSDRLQASPFAYITGYKTKVPLHELDMLGYRFFFSSEPDKVYKRILKIMQTITAFRTRTGPKTPEQLTKDLSDLIWCKFNGLPKEHPFYRRKKGHPMLADLGFNEDTMLVDLRSDD